MTSMTSVRIITQLYCQEPGRNFTRTHPHPSVEMIVDAREIGGSVGKREWILWVVWESVCSSRVPGIAGIAGIDDQLQRDSCSF